MPPHGSQGRVTAPALGCLGRSQAIALIIPFARDGLSHSIGSSSSQGDMSKGLQRALGKVSFLSHTGHWVWMSQLEQWQPFCGHEGIQTKSEAEDGKLEA